MRLDEPSSLSVKGKRQEDKGNCKTLVTYLLEKEDRWVRHVARKGKRGNAHAVLVGKPNEQRPVRKRTARLQIPTK
jgi:hypothetical protein